jgi:hypothetical protein
MKRHLAVAFVLIGRLLDGRLLLAQPPPASSANRSIVNLREQGAAGDGATDDTRSVVSAFAGVCASGGGTVYVPSGVFIVDPAASSIPLCSNLSVYGPGTLRVKPDAGNYRYIFAANPPTAAVNDLSFNGITVDQNASGNTTAMINVDDRDTLQSVWQISAGSNLHFENMRLLLSGVDPITVNGPAVSGVYIERNHIVFQKRPGQPPFDNSSIYIDGDNFHVANNTFTSTSSDAARTAIEIHTGSGAVSGNTIDGYSAGMNLVNLHGASAIGNTVRNADYGISLWSTAAMESVVVSGNTISLAQATRNTPTSWGIATSYNIGINGRFSNLQISGNIVTFEPESSSRTMTGSVNYGIGLQALGNISNVLVVGNQIVRAPVRGIAVGVLDAKYTTARVSVRDNRVVDAGSNRSSEAAAYSAAISLQGNLTSIDVLRNRLDFLSKPFSGHFSSWSFETGYTFRNVVVAENDSTAVDGLPVNGLTPSVIQAYPPQ